MPITNVSFTYLFLIENTLSISFIILNFRKLIIIVRGTFLIIANWFSMVADVL